MTPMRFRMGSGCVLPARLAAISARELAVSCRRSCHRRCLEMGLILVTAGAALVASSVVARCCSWNITASLPRGLYVIHHAAPAVDSIVVFDVPAAVSDLVSARHYLPPGARLLKH